MRKVYKYFFARKHQELAPLARDLRVLRQTLESWRKEDLVSAELWVCVVELYNLGVQHIFVNLVKAMELKDDVKMKLCNIVSDEPYVQIEEDVSPKAAGLD